MANRWGISKEVEMHVRNRDQACVYCGNVFSEGEISRTSKPSWEHIVNDIRINGIENIALCCMSCNASKGAKNLEEWLKTDYCLKKGITVTSVAEVVKNAINFPPKIKA